jgi:hypothetical protein
MTGRLKNLLIVLVCSGWSAMANAVVAEVPEPASFAALGMGLAVLILARRPGPLISSITEPQSP